MNRLQQIIQLLLPRGAAVLLQVEMALCQQTALFVVLAFFLAFLATSANAEEVVNFGRKLLQARESPLDPASTLPTISKLSLNLESGCTAAESSGNASVRHCIYSL